jgi:gliding motility-associated transport system ATP-binding protein
MLVVSKLVRNYGNFVAVDDVSFSTGRGEIVGLLGHNGAGKTTMMKMLSGYLEPNQGHITIDGIDMSLDSKTIQQGLGYLPESLPVYQEMTVADYLDYAGDLKGLKGANKHSEIKRVIEATEIRSKLLDPIATLSRGFKQRVGVAQAILGRPKILILDEPTNGLDPTQTEHMRELIREIAVDATVILSTHIMQEVEALCSRVLILNRGRLAVDSQLSDLRESNRLELTTSMPKTDTDALLSIDGVANLEPLACETREETDAPDGGAIYRYRITLDESSLAVPASAAIAKAVVEAKHALYSLQVAHRDLEVLFRQVSNVADSASVSNNDVQELSNAQGESNAA